MDEQQWLSSTDPSPMLSFLRDSGHLSERKARLFAVACCRRIWHLLPEDGSRRAVAAAELFADGLTGPEELQAAAEGASEATESSFDDSPRAEFGAYSHAAMAAWYLVNDPNSCDAKEVVSWVVGATACDWDDPEFEKEAQAHLLRCVFGRLPARPLLALAHPLLDWHGGAVPKLAQAIYEERSLPSGHLDPARLVVLADMLEEASCNDADLLSHLRGPGPHVRGCWAVDLVLGRE